MQLQLELDGINVALVIKGYTKSDRTEYGCTWCTVDYSFKDKPWLCYEKRNAEILTAEEVDFLTVKLKELLDGQINETIRVDFIEPDFQFELYRCENEVCMDWKVYFWHPQKGLTGNSLSVLLCRTEIEKFWEYLTGVQQNTKEKR